MKPSGRNTRLNSASISSCSARCSSVSNETTQSKLVSGNGIRDTLPTSKRSRGELYFRRAFSTVGGSISTPVTDFAAPASIADP